MMRWMLPLTLLVWALPALAGEYVVDPAEPFYADRRDAYRPIGENPTTLTSITDGDYFTHGDPNHDNDAP
ncbi:MAG: hypothetical protein ACOC95_10020 [Planctomycetota bacterium]